MEHIVDEWTRQDGGQAFQKNQSILVLQISRFAWIRGAWTKHQQQLHFGDQIELPVSGDGQTTSSETYKIGGLIMHSGADHHSGHYTTIHKFHDINWFADDDAPPSPLTEIHERHRREVVQVWCVKEQGVQESTTERKKQKAAEQEPFNPKRRRGENQLYIQMANVTMMGKDVVKWLQSQPTVPIMLVETHMQGEALIQRERMLARQGWKTISVEANQTERGGTNGGFMIVHPISCHMHKVKHYTIEGCGWMAVQWQFDNWAIILILVYFKTGEGIQGQTNAQLWARLTTFTQHLQLPYIVIGDFNVEPGEVAATTIVEHMGGSLLATGQETTLQGSELDWSIVSKNLKPACRLQVQWEVPFKPHGMLVMSIEQEVKELQVAQLIKYPPIPRLEFVRKKWEECEQSVQVEVLDDHVTNVDQKYGEWSAQAEAFVSQNMPGAKQGRGVRIDIEYKPLVDGVKNWVWKRGSLAYWGQFHSRITAGMNSKGINGKGRVHIEQMLWQVEKHWVTQDNVEGFKERVQSLIWHWEEHEANLVMCQIEASEEEIKRTTLEEETDQYRQWLKSGEAKGLRSLFRSLSKEQAAYVRPFQDKPFLERMPLRVKQWTDIWGSLESQVHIPGLRDLIKAGREQGAQLEEISVTHALRVAKRLPQKANGIDGISNDLIRQLPYEGMRSLVQMMEAVEKTGFVPVQWALALVVLIPKNETIERPIALLATTYRFWTKPRTQAVKQWQEELRWRMPWERSTPGSQCLHIAVGRLLRTEIQKAGGKFVVSLLLDMSNFYDRVSLVKLTERFKEVEFPPLAAMVCMQIYSGRRVLDADGECSEPIWPERGILAGCPYAPLCAKVYLSRAMQAFHEKFPQVSADLWVDDCSFDVSGDDPEEVAQQAVNAFRFLRQELEADDLVISMKKSGFVISDKKLKGPMQSRLTADEPITQQVMRDLGCDSAGGNKRRIATLQARMRKGRQRQKQLNLLKIKKEPIRLRLYKGSILASVKWGAEAMGIAPQKRREVRVAMARHMGLQTKGAIDIVYDCNKRHPDPGDQAMIQQIKVIHKLVNHWPEQQWRDLEHAWQATHQRLQEAKHAWQVTYGPLAAMQAYLMEHEWQIGELDRWIREGDVHGRRLELEFKKPWVQLEPILKEHCEAQRLRRISKLSNCQGIVAPLDWSSMRHFQKTADAEKLTAMKTWHQGSLITHGEDGRLQCPICEVEVDHQHLIWTCPWINDRAYPIPRYFMQEISEGKRPELWGRGLRMQVNYTPTDGWASVQGYGTWQSLSKVTVPTHHWVGITVKASSDDPRLRRWVVAIVHHDRDLQRKGAITGMLGGKQNLARGWYWAAVLLHKHTTGRHFLFLKNKQAWEGWTKDKHEDEFWDLSTGLDGSDGKQRLQGLYTCEKRTQQIGRGNQSFKFRNKDIQLVAKERCQQEAPKELEDYLAGKDHEYDIIAGHAAERIQILLKAKDHYATKQGNGKENRQKKVDEKRKLLNKMQIEHQRGGHQWMSAKRGIKCGRCEKAINMHHTVEQIRAAQEESCHAEKATDIKGGKKTRQEIINALVQQEPTDGKHQWETTKYYLKCTKCGANKLKQTNLADFNALIQSKCINQQWEAPADWNGHPTHHMWEKGTQVYCQSCQGKAACQNGKWQASQKLQRKCRAAEDKQASLSAFFGKQQGR